MIESTANPDTHVKIVEVGARDGLQNEKAIVPLQHKVQLINALSRSGLKHIEAGSFVSPKWVPQMADSDEVFKQITRREGVTYSALTPNLKGYEAAKQANVNEVAVFASASEGFSQKNINCSIVESIERFRPLCDEAANDGIPVRAYVSCIFACPYDGKVSISQVVDTCERLLALGCYEISLGDTIGVGTAFDTKRLLNTLTRAIKPSQLAMHFHNTYGQGLANVYASLEAGIRAFDASVAGLGGCPYAKGASGNLATEDLVYLLHAGGLHTGIELDLLAKAGLAISASLSRQSQSSVALARDA
jgi:hydroxymethylglutaryl-CoA lyase